MNGWTFEGQIHRPNRRLAELELWPTQEYPRTPHILEETVPIGETARTGEVMHVLWIWDHRQWRESARIVSPGNDWIRQVAPVVRQSLITFAGRVEPAKPVPDVRPIARRIVEFIDAQLIKCERSDVGRALDLVHTELARRIIRSQGMYSAAAVEASGVDRSPVSDPFPRSLVS